MLHPHVSYLHRIHRCFLKPCGIFESNHPSSPRKCEARMFNVEKRRLRALTGQRNMMGEITCWLSVVDRWIKHTKIVQLNQSRHRTNTRVRVLGVTSALYKIWGEDGEDADASEVRVDWNLQTYNGLSSCVSGLVDAVPFVHILLQISQDNQTHITNLNHGDCWPTSHLVFWCGWRNELDINLLGQ